GADGARADAVRRELRALEGDVVAQRVLRPREGDVPARVLGDGGRVLVLVGFVVGHRDVAFGARGDGGEDLACRAVLDADGLGPRLAIVLGRGEVDRHVLALGFGPREVRVARSVGGADHEAEADGVAAHVGERDEAERGGAAAHERVAVRERDPDALLLSVVEATAAPARDAGERGRARVVADGAFRGAHGHPRLAVVRRVRDHLLERGDVVAVDVRLAALDGDDVLAVARGGHATSRARRPRLALVLARGDGRAADPEVVVPEHAVGRDGEVRVRVGERRGGARELLPRRAVRAADVQGARGARAVREEHAIGGDAQGRLAFAPVRVD